MSENGPFLSICIPTRNRAAFLYRTLRSITDTDVFQKTNDVEIVVSDNASEDATCQIVDLFIQKYGDKIVYFRNETDLLDKNFEMALRLGHGRFLKAHNDTFWLADPSQLGVLLADIKKYERERPVLFFTNEKENLENPCDSLDAFVDTVSYHMTWLGGFGLWKEDLDNMDNFGLYPDKHLTQVEVLLSEISRKKKAVVFKKRYFCYQFLWKKLKGDIVTIFGSHYGAILKEYARKGLLSENALKKEKKRVLEKYILPFSYSLELHGAPDALMRRLLPYYAREPYFYTALFTAFSHYRYKQAVRCLKRLCFGETGLLKREWKKFNRYSSAVPVKVDCPNGVYVGENSRGDLIVDGEKDEKTTLIIGKNVKIGNNVRFVFNDTDNLIFIKDDTEIADGTTVRSDANHAG